MSETCRDFDALIARSAQLTNDEAAKLEAHLASCASCRELAGAFKPVTASAFAATLAPGDELQMTAATLSPETDASIQDARHLRESTRYRITGEVGRG